ncbi:MAG TPA: MFS transporter [Elusimicrobiota bacterium]|nr:MFS transporter [Elusimicrobiota bacterium]
MRSILSRVWLILLCRVLMSAGYSLAFPYFAVYLSRERSVSLELIGAAMAASLLVSALAQILGGRAADKLGRRPVMLGGVLARAAFILALAFAVRAGSSFVLLMALHFAGSFAAGFFDSSSDAWVSDWFPESERLQAFSWLRTGGNLGWALGPALGGLFMSGAGYAALFFWTAAVYAVCFVLLWTMLQESHASGVAAVPDARTGMTQAIGDSKLWILGAGTVLIGVVMSQLITPLSLYAVDFLRLSALQLGLLFSLNGAIVVLFQIPLSRLGRDVKLSVFLCGGCLLYALGYASLSVLARPDLIALAIAVVTFGEISASPALNAVAANLASEETRGTYLGALRFFRQIGWALGPWLGGLGLARWGGAFPCPYWLMVGVCAVAATAVFARLRSRLSEREEGVASRFTAAPEAA